MKNRTLILTGMLVLSSVFASAQKTAAKTKTLIIGPKTGNCAGITQRGACYQVKTNKSQKEWSDFQNPIKGFNYKPGFEYVILVKIQKAKEPVEGVNEEYVLVKQVSKKKSK
ncbi:DUF4377 domain-containing protein [Chryseobacterium polytrichastri]|uniref:DUF4377 domain-containing protein n=1 Tax=Chryseobacterium polytrichastri TaxID=1302687 RepID=A0A1M7L925_9FLAO|nr:DUF4377 domain-containing protein [Chryseobacterium polytrichastri]SHM74637.1 protein of unknown function [Chryseobacterium polytrichastri]